MNKATRLAADGKGWKALAASAGCVVSVLATGIMVGFGQPAPQQATEKAPATQPAEKPAEKPAGQPVTKAPEAQKPAAETPAAPAQPAADERYVLGHTVKNIDGTDVDLSSYKGKVVLIVNVASKCGFTPQYQGLEELYSQYKDQGFVVLGFPSNDFGNQEPGSEKEIKEMCSSKYKITFPMFSKIKVTGKDAHPLYKQLASQKAPAGGEPKWNFNKYLIDRNGQAVERFESGAKPTSDDIKKKVENLLSAK